MRTAALSALPAIDLSAVSRTVTFWRALFSCAFGTAGRESGAFRPRSKPCFRMLASKSASGISHLSGNVISKPSVLFVYVRPVTVPLSIVVATDGIAAGGFAVDEAGVAAGRARGRGLV